MECISSIQVKVQYGLIKCLITSILREHQNNFNKILKFLLLLITPKAFSTDELGRGWQIFLNTEDVQNLSIKGWVLRKVELNLKGGGRRLYSSCFLRQRQPSYFPLFPWISSIKITSSSVKILGGWLEIFNKRGAWQEGAGKKIEGGQDPLINYWKIQLPSQGLPAHFLTLSRANLAVLGTE